MGYYVENCFHWIGFHIVNHLLEDGFSVDGFSELDTDKKEALSMFVGRNELFRLLGTDESKSEYDAVIRVNNGVVTMETQRSVTINLPLVFGEWAPMNSEGIYYEGKLIRFDSQQFKLEAIYIEEFLKSFWHWMSVSETPSIINVRSYSNRRAGGADEANAVYIRRIRPLEEYVESVKKHYQKYKKLYPACNGQ
ncbi:hypothetical protein SAMN05216238_10186 [Lentibacillus persicus]|uniref:Uncharacterized protein n=1 Tax=Lentibacillus persicus TaxID=640948 RepID=A0A1I1RWN8_9BACI|nr:hypothetical protein [Lentibacillus persicus]SFD38472.1 hypothetical protein SAMN05216238_10186 [Lentibacillus persicus]